MKRLLLALGFLASSSVFSAPFASTPLNFSLPQMNSNPRDNYTTAAHPNSVFVLENYFNECPWCNRNSGNVNDLATAYKDNMRVQVLDLSIDQDEDSYEEWIANNSPNHPVVMDQGRKVSKMLGTSAYPTTYVVDCTGKVQHRSEGLWNASEKKAVYAAVEAALKVTCPAE